MSLLDLFRQHSCRKCPLARKETNMKILLPNDQLAAVTRLLAGMSLKPAASRAICLRETSTRFRVGECE